MRWGAWPGSRRTFTWYTDVIQHCVCSSGSGINRWIERWKHWIGRNEGSVGYGGQQTQSIDIHHRSLTTDVYGGFRCLEERSVDGRWMENHTTCRSVHRMCWSCMCYSWWSSLSEPVQIVGCDVDQVDPSTDRNERVVPCSSVVEWKLHHLSYDGRPAMCSSSVNSRSMGGSSSGVSILDRLHRLDWMVGEP